MAKPRANQVLNQQSGAVTASGDSGVLDAIGCDVLGVDIDITALTGTTPSITFALQHQGADGVWYTLWTGTAHTAAALDGTSVGPGCATNKVFGDNVKLTWTVSGTTPSITFSASIIGKRLGPRL